MLLAVNVCPMTGVAAESVSSEKGSHEDAVARAAEYLGTKLNADNSFGSSKLINDTAYALSALKTAGAEGYEDSFKWLDDNADYENTDITARLASVTGSAEYLRKLEVRQNDDSGFGLYPGYSSDVLDSVLVLGAMNDTDYSAENISASDICAYLLSEVNEDGGFSYAEGNKSDPMLSAAVVYDVGRFMTANGFTMEPFKSSVSYIEANITDSYEDEGIRATICKYLALNAAGQQLPLDEVISSVEAAQKADGSFVGDITTTYWAVKLLSDKGSQPSPETTTTTTTTTTAPKTTTTTTKAPKTTTTITTTSKTTTSSSTTTTTTTIIPAETTTVTLLLGSKEDGDRLELSWNDISSETERYDYQLLRRENGGEWNTSSMWNGKEKVRVLNIYPFENYLEGWMNEPLEKTDSSAGKDLLDIMSVSFEAFVKAPDTYIYNEDGSCKYDVIYFDGDTRSDLTDEAYDVVRGFVDSGRGVLFGHDTICGAYNMINKTNFNKFADDLKFKINESLNYEWNGIDKANVVKKGIMTLYPWSLSGQLTVPGTHTSGQYNYGATEWLVLDTERRVDSETGGKDSFYLATCSNLGMIQTGHTRGQASDDERKVLANTLFYLYQRAPKTEAFDAAFIDACAPAKPEILGKSVKNGSVDLTIRSEDKAGSYEYMAKAVSQTGDSEAVYSNVITQEVLSGLAGFVVKVTDSRAASAGLVEFDEESGAVIGLIGADEEGTAKLALGLEESDKPQYIHIIAIDKADNISRETVIPVSEHDTDLRLADPTYTYDHSADLVWNDISDDNDRYNYQLFRRTNGGDWNSISAWNGKNTVNVLNVYPEKPYLEQWMTEPLEGEEVSAGKDMINVTSVYFSEFNYDPEKYMYNKDGSWKYDVIFFGSADCNNGFDLNEEAYAVTRKFADSGGGILFGHDTVVQSVPCPFYIFARFADDLGIVLRDSPPSEWEDITSAKAIRRGVITGYPWYVSGTLAIPPCHSSGQFNIDGTEWMLLDHDRWVDEETGGKNFFYLLTKNNFGLIQTGHSNGQASDDEKKVLANTLFYLYQQTPDTSATDQDLYDVNSPKKPKKVKSTLTDSRIWLTVDGEDVPTSYEYYVKANSRTGLTDSVKSNIVKTEAKSGIKGFVAIVTKTMESARDLLEFEEDGITLKNLVSADSSGRADLEAELDDTLISQCVHIFAVDNADNISAELTLPIVVGVKLGDVNFDGKVNAVDASQVLAQYAKASVNEPYDFTEKQFAAGDIDENGILDAVDASAILAYYTYLATGGELDDMRDWLKLDENAAIRGN